MHLMRESGDDIESCIANGASSPSGEKPRLCGASMTSKIALARARLRAIHAEGDLAPKVAKIRAYLTHYGYLKKCRRCEPQFFCQHMGRAVLLYQQFHHLSVTGIVSVEMLEHMARDRCGNPDLLPGPIPRPSVRDSEGPATTPFLVSHLGPWPRLELTYFVENYTDDLPREVIDRQIRLAFDEWSNVSPLQFSRVEDAPADIVLGFYPQRHQDQFTSWASSDGFGNAVAHSDYRPIRGQTFIHFNDALTWAAPPLPLPNPDNKRDLRGVAIHEIGHAVGLLHSSHYSAIMDEYGGNAAYPNYLAEVDVAAIRSLYPFPVGTTDMAVTVPLDATLVGSDSVVLDLGRTRWVLAWGQIAFLDPRESGGIAALDILAMDRTRSRPVAIADQRLGPSGSAAGLFVGARVARARTIQFRLRALGRRRIGVAGHGNVLVLD